MSMRPAGERPVPLGLDELRADRPPRQLLERRVEPLDVPDLERHAGLRGECDQVVRLGQRAAHRLLDQHRHAGRQERRRDRVVVDSRGDDAHRIDLPEERLEVRRTPVVPSFAATARACSGFASTTPTRSTSGRPGEDAGVVLAQVPDADHRHPQPSHVCLVNSRVATSQVVVSKIRPPGSPACRPSGSAPSDRRTRPRERTGAGQVHVQRVPGAVRDDVPGEVEPAQGQVADQVQDLVPGRLVGEPQPRCRSARGGRTPAGRRPSGGGRRPAPAARPPPAPSGTCGTR